MIGDRLAGLLVALGEQAIIESDALEQAVRRKAKMARDIKKGIKANVRGAALNATILRPVHVRVLREFLLREPQLLPAFADRVPQLLPLAHDSKLQVQFRDGLRHICPRHLSLMREMLLV